MIDDSDVEKIIGVLRPRIKEESSKNNEENEELLQQIRKLKEQNNRLKKEMKIRTKKWFELIQRKMKKFEIKWQD